MTKHFTFFRLVLGTTIKVGFNESILQDPNTTLITFSFFTLFEVGAINNFCRITVVIMAFLTKNGTHPISHSYCNIMIGNKYKLNNMLNNSQTNALLHGSFLYMAS